MEAAAATPSTPPRQRQLRLFAVENPLATRIGADFFRGLPAGPGVYFFFDAAGVLLYIGQSNDLRARVGSYRHVTPERHPRRTLRLVHRIARIEWKACATPADAIELERVLLLEKRPPFNRAGTWPGYPWWLAVSATDDHVEVRLSRHAPAQDGGIGPLPSGFRHALGSFLRCTHRLMHPQQPLTAFPMGLLDHAIPLRTRLFSSEPSCIAASIVAFSNGDAQDRLADFLAILTGAAPLELEYWTSELDALQKFTAKAKHLPVSELSYPAVMALPLFPEL